MYGHRLGKEFMGTMPALQTQTKQTDKLYAIKYKSLNLKSIVKKMKGQPTNI